MIETDKCPKCGSTDILLEFALAPNECKKCGNKWSTPSRETPEVSDPCANYKALKKIESKLPLLDNPVTEKCAYCDETHECFRPVSEEKEGE